MAREKTPMVAVGHGETAPWAELPLTCPECGAGPLELQQSDPPGLTFIAHCGKSWLRGQPNFEQLFPGSTTAFEREPDLVEQVLIVSDDPGCEQ